MLYTILRGDRRSALDAGFMNSDERGMAESTSSGRAVQRGNPVKKDLSNEYKAMLRCAEPNFDYKPPEEQNSLAASMSRLYKLGVRIARFVNTFEIGVLCFLPVRFTSRHAQHVLEISETWQVTSSISTV